MGCEAFDPVDALAELHLDELAAVARQLGVDAHGARWQLVSRISKTLRWRPFTAARDFAQSLGLSSAKGWGVWHRSRPDLSDLPACPDQVYKGRGWVGWGDFLGTGNMGRHAYRFRSFVSARVFVRRLKLRSNADWSAWCRGERPDLPSRPDDVPTNPHRTYPEWGGMGDWLGTGTVQTQAREFMPFDEARRLVRTLRFGSLYDYHAWRRELRPDLPPPPRAGLPGHPQTVYQARWRGWGDFLGTGRTSTATMHEDFLPFHQARAFVRSLRLRTWSEWQGWTRGTLAGKPKRPPGVPTNPNRTYTGRGWVSMTDWLGTRPKARSKR